MGILSRKKEEQKNDGNPEVVGQTASSKKSSSTKVMAGKQDAKEDNKGAKKNVSTEKKKISGEKEILAEKSLVRPWVSEKSAVMMGKGVYIFSVSKSVSKNSVKDVVESLYGVKAVNVSILNVKGKLKNFKGKSAYRSDRKKAVVTLKEGQKIEELAI